ncbi:heat shock 70 kDa protein [Trifolium repens]|nr:heat shock 70 kDa protein [Trifolium repens]
MVSDFQSKLDDKYHEFVIASEREALTAKLQEVEDWLYEDGEDETKDVYVANLKSSKRLKKSMQNKDNDKGNEDCLSIIEEKRIEKIIVEMHMPSVLLCKNLGNPFGIYRQRI